MLRGNLVICLKEILTVKIDAADYFRKIIHLSVFFQPIFPAICPRMCTENSELSYDNLPFSQAKPGASYL